MQHQHFNTIIDDIIEKDGVCDRIRVSLRNQETYQGRWERLPDAPDIIRINHVGRNDVAVRRVYVALTAIATVEAIS